MLPTLYIIKCKWVRSTSKCLYDSFEPRIKESRKNRERAFLWLSFVLPHPMVVIERLPFSDTSLQHGTDSLIGDFCLHSRTWLCWGVNTIPFYIFHTHTQNLWENYFLNMALLGNLLILRTYQHFFLRMLDILSCKCSLRSNL